MEVIVMPAPRRDVAQEIANLQMLDPFAVVRAGTPSDLASHPKTRPFTMTPGAVETIFGVIEGRSELQLTIGMPWEGNCLLSRNDPITGEITKFPLEPYKLRALRVTGTWQCFGTLVVQRFIFLDESIF